MNDERFSHPRKKRIFLAEDVAQYDERSSLRPKDVLLHDGGVALHEKSGDLCVKDDDLCVKDVGLAGKSVALEEKSVALEAKSVGLSGLCQSEVARNGDLCVKDVALEEKNVAPEEKSVDLGVVKLDPEWVGSVELVGVDEVPLGESHDRLGGRDVLEVHAEGVGEVNQGITFISQN